MPLLIGAVMGLGSHALRNERLIRMPEIRKSSFNPAFLLDSAFGAVASLIAVIISDPEELRIVIVISVLAGYAGENFIRHLAQSNFSANYQDNQENEKSIDEVIDYERSDKENKKG
jgi:hypothetical protein